MIYTVTLRKNVLKQNLRITSIKNIIEIMWGLSLPDKLKLYMNRVIHYDI